MHTESPSPAPVFKPLRWWPALLLAVIMVLCRYVPRFIEGASSQYWFIPIFFPLFGCVLMLIWWLAASRATWWEKLGGLVGVAALAAVAGLLSHASMRGFVTIYLMLPLGFIGFALGAMFNSRTQATRRLAGILTWSALAMGLTLLLRNEGITGDYAFDLQPRWTAGTDSTTWAAAKAPAAKPPGEGAAIETALAKAEWPGFRGADRRGHAPAAKLVTDWSASPPKLLWKKPVGAGWSSFAVAGPYAFTQEQRGDNEAVVCYDLATGNEVWAQQRAVRFDEPMGGPGPRSTPTLAEGAVFTASPSGVLQRLKAATGEVEWQQDFKALSGRQVPMWGYASSPLVTQGLAIVFAGGAGDKGLMAFDAATGQPRWSVPCGPESYSSPQLSKVLGEDRVLMLTNDGLLVVEPANGHVRLNYEWKFQGYRALQPTVVGDDVVLLPTPMSEGTRAIRLSKKDGRLGAEELWTTKHMKPDFTELIVHKGYLYGIDGSMFSCVDLKNGERIWKDGRYGKGEAVLLEAQDLILISAEDGRVVLLQAGPGAHKELTSFQALKGKTWNHPVLVDNKLLVRNGAEAACYALPEVPLVPLVP